MRHRGAWVGVDIGIDLRTKVRVADVIRQAQPAKLGEVGSGKIARSPTGDPGIERDHNSGVPRGLSTVHQTFGELAVGGRIELEKPWGVAEFGRDILQRIHRQRRHAQGYPGARGRAGRRDIAVPVSRTQSDHADGCHEDRGPAPSPEFHRHIAFGGANEHPGNQSPLLERGDVGALGALVARAAGHIRPDRR